MQKIINIKKYNYDCCENHFYLINDNAVVCFFQGLNRDLIFSILSFKKINKVSFIVKKEEFKELYDLIDGMINEIHSRKDIIGYEELFEKGFFSWQSDAPANEESWNTNDIFVYNYFNILPIESAYKLEFINSTNKNRFTVEINTDRSRYDRIRFDVWDLYKELENVCDIGDETILNSNIKQLALKYKNIIQ